MRARKGEPLFEGVPQGSRFYFAHSFAPPPSDDVVATCTYGSRFPAAVRKWSVAGVQFHPEKSSAHGLTVLGNFIALAEEKL